MTNSPTIETWQAGFGMPSSARVRGAALRGLPVTTSVDVLGSAHPCALSQANNPAINLATGLDYSADRPAMTDSAMTSSAMTSSAVNGAFPGTSAWSPPI